MTPASAAACGLGNLTADTVVLGRGLAALGAGGAVGVNVIQHKFKVSGLGKHYVVNQVRGIYFNKVVARQRLNTPHFFKCRMG